MITLRRPHQIMFVKHLKQSAWHMWGPGNGSFAGYSLGEQRDIHKKVRYLLLQNTPQTVGQRTDTQHYLITLLHDFWQMRWPPESLGWKAPRPACRPLLLTRRSQCLSFLGHVTTALPEPWIWHLLSLTATLPRSSLYQVLRIRAAQINNRINPNLQLPLAAIAQSETSTLPFIHLFPSSSTSNKSPNAKHIYLLSKSKSNHVARWLQFTASPCPEGNGQMPQHGGSWGLPREAAAYLTSPVIFDLFHLMAHKLSTKILQHTKQYVIFFGNLTKK